MAQTRKKFTPDEAGKMLEFLKDQLEKDNPSAWHPKGNLLWKKAARLKITPHTAQSMRDFMRRSLIKNLEFANCGLETREYIRKRLAEKPPSSPDYTLLDDGLEIMSNDGDRNVSTIQPSETSTPKSTTRRRGELLDIAAFIDEFEDDDEKDGDESNNRGRKRRRLYRGPQDDILVVSDSVEEQRSTSRDNDREIENASPPIIQLDEDAFSSPDGSFESASAESPRFRQFKVVDVDADADVENRTDFEKKVIFLRELALKYGVDISAIKDIIMQLRTQHTEVDLMTVEITLWKKKKTGF